MSDTKAAIEAQVDRLLEKLTEYENFPEEPNGDSVLHIRVRFNNYNTIYNYAGVYNHSLGVWYLTGKNTQHRYPHGMTWEQICKWISAYEHSIYAATEYVHVSGEVTL